MTRTLSALLRGSLATTVVAVATTALVAAATQNAQAQTAYAIGVNGTTLVSFNVATPGVTTTIGNLTGAVTNLEDLDFRPSDGLLYGFDPTSNKLVTINLTTAVTTLVATPTTPSQSLTSSIDFNPVTDRLRVVSTLNENLRINPAGGATTVDGTLRYAAGDTRANVTPFIFSAAAYTNNFVGAGSTTLYYIDANANGASSYLVTTSDPNSGVLNTVGALGVMGTQFTGFDIYTSAGGVNTGYAILSGFFSDHPSLYTVNLQTGTASLVGAINASLVNGLAIQPVSTAAAAPEPGSITLLLLAGVPVVGIVRRRKTPRLRRGGPHTNGKAPWQAP